MPPAPTHPSNRIHFGPFVVDPQEARVLLHDVPIKLRRKARLVLTLLARNQGQLISTASILNEAWPDVTVTPHVITDIVSTLRRVLARDGSARCRIETERGVGYRLIVEGHTDGGGASATAGTQAEAEFVCVSRDEELATLADRWQACLEGRPQVVLVAGVAGIGKSALVRHFAQGVAARADAMVFTGACHDGLSGSEPYQPLFQMFDAMEAHLGRERLTAAMRRCAPAWLAQLPWLVDADEQESLRHRTAGSHPARLQRETTTLLRDLSCDAPILLVLEDLHWSHVSTLNLVDALAHQPGGSPVMVVATYRTLDLQLRDDGVADALTRLCKRLASLDHATEIALRPWPPGGLGAYARRRLGARLAPELEAALERQSGGSPLIARGLLDGLLRDGVLQQHGSYFCVPPGVRAEHTELPIEVAAMIQSQWQILSPPVRRLLQAAAAVGDSFSALDVVQVGDDVGDEDTARERLEELCDQSCFIERAESLLELGDYAFQHACFRRAALDSLAPAAARRLFRRAVDSVAATELHEAEIAARYAAGHAWEQAADHWEAAAGTAVRSLAYDQAATWTESAIDCLAQLPRDPRHDRRMALRCLDVGNLRIVTSGYRSEAAHDAFARARQLGRDSGDIVAEYRAITGELTAALFRGERTDAQARQAELDAIAAERPHLRAMTELMRSSLQIAGGYFADSVNSAEEGMGWLGQAEPGIPVLMDLGASLLSQRAAAAAIACDADRWRACCDELLAKMPHSPGQDRSSYFLLALGAMVRRADDKAQEWARAGLGAALEIGDSEFRALHTNCLMVTECRAGTASAADLDAAVVQQVGDGYVWAADQFIAWVAEAYLSEGNTRAAVAALQRVLPASTSYVPEVWRVLGDALRAGRGRGAGMRLKDGLPNEPSACYAEALRLAEERGATLFAERARQSTDRSLA